MALAVAMLRRARNSQCWINRLPLELITTIFDLVIDSPADKWRYDSPTALQLSHVCLHWRVVSLQHPRMWSILGLQFTSKACANLYIQRSGNYPLSLSMGPHNIAIVPWQTALCHEHIARIRYLHAHAAFINLCEGAWPKGYTAPLLEELRVSRYVQQLSYTDFLSRDGATPALRKLVIAGNNISFTFRPFRGLTTLRVVDGQAPIDAIIQYCKACLGLLQELPYLVNLVLDLYRYGSSVVEQSNTLDGTLTSTHIALPSLRNFKVSSPTPLFGAFLMASLYLPSTLESFELNVNRGYAQPALILSPTTLPPNFVTSFIRNKLVVNISHLAISNSLDSKSKPQPYFALRMSSYGSSGDIHELGSLLRQYYPMPSLKTLILLGHQHHNPHTGTPGTLSPDLSEGERLLPLIHHTQTIEELCFSDPFDHELCDVLSHILTKSASNGTRLWPNLKQISLSAVTLHPETLDGIAKLFQYIYVDRPSAAGRDSAFVAALNLDRCNYDLVFDKREFWRSFLRLQKLVPNLQIKCPSIGKRRGILGII